MILFKPEMAKAILEGRKVCTRRRWKRPRAKVGAVHQARTTLFGSPFAYLRIRDVRQERYPGSVVSGSISPSFARDVEGNLEGFRDWEEFRSVFAQINGAKALGEPCYRVEFAVVPGPAAGEKAKPPADAAPEASLPVEGGD